MGPNTDRIDLKKASQLRLLLATMKILLLPGSSNVLSAILIEQAGFKEEFIFPSGGTPVILSDILILA